MVFGEVAGQIYDCFWTAWFNGSLIGNFVTIINPIEQNFPKTGVLPLDT